MAIKFLINKLLKEITSPEIFVKGKFQEIFKKHANELFAKNPKFFINKGIPNAIVLETLAKNNKLMQHKVFDFIKIE